ncbi:MAG: cysteine synthase family protein [Anaerolineae bacterium]|nr:cysteine synthase family protein [Anaerolineae bacterium]MDQ7035084.1 cysteine synthase family protein [Anaerolineae bacterium]
MSALRKVNYHTASNLAAVDVEAQIGNTPLLGFRHITAHLPENIQVYAKAEWANLGGSVKDRAAREIVHQAFANGDLGNGKILIDSTSGNTGIAYAMLGAARGFGVKLFLPESASPERIAILRAYGVDLVFTDPLEGSDGAIIAVRELVQREPDKYFYADQYNNPANWQAHYKTTGVEIWQQTQGKVTHFVAGLGTSGTLTGTGRRLKAYNSAIQIISAQPNLAFHGIEGWKHMASAMKPGIYNPTFADRDMGIDTEESYRMARRLAREEGYLVGISAAAAMVATLRVAEEHAENGESAIVVTLFPDNAYKYLSANFWHD